MKILNPDDSITSMNPIWYNVSYYKKEELYYNLFKILISTIYPQQFFIIFFKIIF